MKLRDVPRSKRNAFRRAMREVVEDYPRRRNYAAAVCDRNARIRAALDRAQVDGKVGFVVNGRDCDCVSYHRESVGDAFPSVHHYLRWDEERCEWLDGPESVNLVRPDQIDRGRNESRDLALEAYEDGHPHVVYAPAIPAGVI